MPAVELSPPSNPGEGDLSSTELVSKLDENETRSEEPSPSRGEGRVRGAVAFARALRRSQTPHEQKLWARLCNRRLNGF